MAVIEIRHFELPRTCLVKDVILEPDDTPTIFRGDMPKDQP